MSQTTLRIANVWIIICKNITMNGIKMIMLQIDPVRVLYYLFLLQFKKLMDENLSHICT
jgi:hypothetical protein